ncbi:MAG: nitroreductase [Pseudonocardia sp.]|nr:nitroreductase [Pseudonocardia sp.]
MSTMTGTLGLSEEQTHGLLRTAGLAPSLHNTQPWRFRLAPDSIEIHLDRARQLRIADPDGRELRIAGGAALYNLRLGLAGLGIRPLVTVLPDPGNPDLIAILRRGGTRRPTPEQQRLLAAVPRRRTNRRPFAEVPVASPARYDLTRAAVEEGAWLHLVTDPEQRSELGNLARQAHQRQTADPDFLAEITAWTGREPGRRDGVPASAGGPQPLPNEAWVMRDYTAGTGRVGGPGFEADPLIGVLSVHADGPREDIRAGEALERILLTATVHGLSVSFLSQLVEVPDIRTRMRRLISGTRPPLAVLRIGHGWPIAATPRLDAGDLVLPAASTATADDTSIDEEALR